MSTINLNQVTGPAAVFLKGMTDGIHTLILRVSIVLGLLLVASVAIVCHKIQGVADAARPDRDSIARPQPGQYHHRARAAGLDPYATTTAADRDYRGAF